MEDELLHTRHQATQLQESRSRIAAAWEDEAAREINLRYLNPHADENGLMLQSCAQQVEQLTVVDSGLQAAEEAALAVEALAVEILEQLSSSDEELTLSHQFFEHHAQSASLARSLFLDVDQLIRQAASICEGVPKT